MRRTLACLQKAATSAGAAARIPPVKLAYKNMLRDPSSKYSAFKAVDLPNRTWPNNAITKAPRWLSTDLRDGNQSLPDPMSIPEKKEYFHKLVEVGFKEIEVSFPSASQTDFDFTRYAVENAPEDVAIQVLTQSREPLIRRTVESVKGAKKAIIHTYLATSDVFRDVVFGMSKEDAIAKAIETTRLVRSLTKDDPAMQDTEWTFEFSPECFSDTPTDFAVEICEAVKAAWEPTAAQPIIFNLPATVEVAGPNVYADQIEYFCSKISEREKVVVSVHCHNDRGCGVAATELGLLAGADRVEGCLFGNGERTGNVDLVTVALNMYTQGVSPELDLSDMESIIAISEKCNKIPVHPRAPYGGDLVVCAFSGSHQDAIKKGFAKAEARDSQKWTIPYLPLDPKDIGRSYEAVIRVNSQSGKGGAAWVVLRSLGLDLPRNLQVVFSSIVQQRADSLGRELKTDEIIQLFKSEYLATPELTLRDFEISKNKKASTDNDREIFLVLETAGGQQVNLKGQGNGPISAFLDALSQKYGTLLEVVNYSEHMVGKGSQSKAATYVELSYINKDNQKVRQWGCGIHSDVSQASFEAILSIANSLVQSGEIAL
ncbi:2-isopropylmalate synthase [Suhomyces tanzawaensis NRRL Y-17324]|uniref:2-isopropylmalate synthase n=1 Tax=Suhomyces tanzawaensis NRRL Y-17324 TaxID=984487 RepID=A0A1E4SBF8_9ASCO|nr:2-isopropylmalate synthase [Suhomyces tanzawaensis NRRL Y-17324]ODV76831.1 2-isopropylmalate synthase [Suhomyces tanzawaensis NRRL Y-17324]